MSEKIRAYVDLLRLHFFFVWPVLFSAGLFVGFTFNGGFSWTLILQAVLIAFLGFEAGLVLNDIVDANLDKKELPEDKRLTKYWRPFGERPLAQGLISPRNAALLFFVLVAATIAVIVTLPYPHSLYVFALMAACYGLEVFYQVKKRNEQFPFAQLLGRVDFALFLVAGYLVVGTPDVYALALFLFFYPLALAHLGVNDLVDVANDKAKGMNTPPTLYGMNATAYWVLGFTVVHFAFAVVFLYFLGSYLAVGGFAISFGLLTVANILVLRGKDAASALKALPMLHLSMLIYAITIIASFALPLPF
ncbi:MAG: UbiA family prenyltransferase [Candidatus Bathyarchaeota archaeon]|nr:UbiA family prenyltransferase [Candidatus Bathyarchaeota archaeon]